MNREINSLAQAKRQLLKIGIQLHDKDLQMSSGGNISIRLHQEDKENRIVITPSGYSFYDCSPEQLLVLDLEGNIIDGEAKPSRETGFHLGIYRSKPSINGIIHTHSPWATSFAVRGKSIPLLTPHAESILKELPLIPYAQPGSERLAQLIIEFFSKENISAALLEGHGLIGIGDNLVFARNIIELVEETAKIALIAEISVNDGDST